MFKADGEKKYDTNMQDFVPQGFDTKLVELTYDDILLDIFNTVWWNDHVDVRNFFKYESDKQIRWFGLKDGEEFVAYMGANPDAEIQLYNGIFPAYGGCYVWAKSGHEYGAKLIEAVVELLGKECRKKHDAGDKDARVCFQFIVDPMAKVSLVANYFKNFNEASGWRVLPVKNEYWSSILFVKDFYEP